MKAYASVATALRHIGRNVPMMSAINQGGVVVRQFQGTHNLSNSSGVKYLH